MGEGQGAQTRKPGASTWVFSGPGGSGRHDSEPAQGATRIMMPVAPAAPRLGRWPWGPVKTRADGPGVFRFAATPRHLRQLCGQNARVISATLRLGTGSFATGPGGRRGGPATSASARAAHASPPLQGPLQIGSRHSTSTASPLPLRPAQAVLRASPLRWRVSIRRHRCAGLAPPLPPARSACSVCGTLTCSPASGFSALLNSCRRGGRKALCVAPRCTVLHHAALCCTALHCVAPRCTVLHHAALCCAVSSQ